MNDNNYEPYQYGNYHTEQEQKETDNFSDYHYEEPKSTEPPKKKKGHKWLTCIAMAIVFGLVSGGIFVGVNVASTAILGLNTHNVTKVETTEVKTTTGTTVLSDVADVAEGVMPSVVSITNMSIQEVKNYFFGGVTQYESESSGSGIIIGQNDSELLLVTNNHVVEGSQTLTVSFIDEETVEARIKGTDADMDLAIIAVPLSSIKESTMEKIKVATLGDSDELRVGEPTIAIGNALGYGQSVTTGIVSATERQIEDYEGELIQTDAAINPGNSGGALLNAAGEVIGINTIKVSADAVEGMGYAIPISDVTDILNELMNKVTRSKVAEGERGVIGIRGVTVDETTSEMYSMPEGVHVSEVIQGSAAEKAGMVKGSIITEIDGTDVDTMEELQEQLTYFRAGETVTLTVELPSENGYVEKEIEITLGKQ